MLLNGRGRLPRCPTVASQQQAQARWTPRHLVWLLLGAAGKVHWPEPATASLPCWHCLRMVLAAPRTAASPCQQLGSEVRWMRLRQAQTYL